jgi:hypothetical protein
MLNLQATGVLHVHKFLCRQNYCSELIVLRVVLVPIHSSLGFQFFCMALFEKFNMN